MISGDSPKAVSNVQLQLVNAKQKVIQTIKSEFDGFYLFQIVPPGKYWIRISPEQIKRLGLKNPELQEVNIKGEEMILSGMDLFLEQVKTE